MSLNSVCCLILATFALPIARSFSVVQHPQEGAIRRNVASNNTAVLSKSVDMVNAEGEYSVDGLGAGSMDNCFSKPTSREVKSTTFMEHLAKTPWVSIPPKPIERRKPKVALLMFAKDRVENEQIWLRWMEDAKTGGLDFRLFIHAYGLPPRIPGTWQSPEFEKYLVKEQVRTYWCQMWDAQMLLLQHALKDQDVTHMMLLSQDSVPVKPLHYIYNEIEKDPLTRMCADDWWREHWPRAETWWLMRRGDAELFDANFAFAHKNFVSGCTEEQGWYYPLRLRWDEWGDQAPIKKECVMFTDWKDGDKACKEVWAENVEKCNCKALRTSNRTDAGFRHPATFHNVDQTAFTELLVSPFWFARKFTDNAIDPALSSLLQQNLTQQVHHSRRERREERRKEKKLAAKPAKPANPWLREETLQISDELHRELRR